MLPHCSSYMDTFPSFLLMALGTVLYFLLFMLMSISARHQLRYTWNTASRVVDLRLVNVTFIYIHLFTVVISDVLFKSLLLLWTVMLQYSDSLQVLQGKEITSKLKTFMRKNTVMSGF